VAPPPVDPAPPPPAPIPNPPPPPPAPPIPPEPLPSSVLTGFRVASAPVTLSKNLAPIVVTCPKAAKGACSGTVTIQGEARALAVAGASPTAKTVRLGRRSFTVPRGGTARIRVPLSARALNAVKRAGKLKVTVLVTARDSAGKRAQPITRALWLKGEKPKKNTRVPRTPG
jgi:hypothetical protein